MRKLKKYEFFRLFDQITEERRIKKHFFKHILISKFYQRKRLMKPLMKHKLRGSFKHLAIQRYLLFKLYYIFQLNYTYEKFLRTCAYKLPKAKLEGNIHISDLFFQISKRRNIHKKRRLQTFKKLLKLQNTKKKNRRVKLLIKKILRKKPKKYMEVTHSGIFKSYTNFDEDRFERREWALDLALFDYNWILKVIVNLNKFLRLRKRLKLKMKYRLGKKIKYIINFCFDKFERHDYHFPFFYLPIIRDKESTLRKMTLKQLAINPFNGRTKQAKQETVYRFFMFDLKMSLLIQKHYGYFIPIIIQRQFANDLHVQRYKKFKKHPRSFWFIYFRTLSRLNKGSIYTANKSLDNTYYAHHRRFRRVYAFSRRTKPLKLKLLFKNFLFHVYGNIRKKQLLQYFKKAQHKKFLILNKFISLLEFRLDVALFRLNFLPSVKAARKFISQKKVLLNNKIIVSHSHNIKPNDIISIIDKEIAPIRSKLFFEFLYGHPFMIQIPRHFEIDYTTLSFCLANKNLNLKKNYYKEFRYISNVLFYEK